MPHWMHCGAERKRSALQHSAQTDCGSATAVRQFEAERRQDEVERGAAGGAGEAGERLGRQIHAPIMAHERRGVPNSPLR